MTGTVESAIAATGLVQTELRGNVILIGLNRPDKHNALDQAQVWNHQQYEIFEQTP